MERFRVRLSGALGRLAARVAPARQPRPWLTEVIMAKYTTDKALWLTKDRDRVVEDGDPEAAFLLASKGKEIDAETVKKYGLGPKQDKPAEGKQQAPVEDKAVKGPQATKGKA